MASARWHGHGKCRGVYFRQIHALSAASPMNRFVLLNIPTQMHSGTHNNFLGLSGAGIGGGVSREHYFDSQQM